ncbi:cupin domain-containing protein [Ottowia pentelensis]|uniref:AraC family transcriptional regulator n=1 Tax=Ottowia pentelensis TaxID=511108 RepID=UPI00363E7C76
MLPPGTSNVIAFHVVLEGECWIRHAARDWFAVHAGQVAVISHGGRHELGDQPGRPSLPFEAMLGGRPLLAARHLQFDTGPGGTSKVLCGFLGCDRRAFEPLCGSLPPVFQVDLGERMQTLVPYAVANALDDSPGAEGLRGRLAELLFLGALRIYLRELPANASGWLAGVRDPVIGRAMQAMHAAPQRHWTLDELAAAAASSRSAVAARFSEVLDESPMRYLTRLRMAVAARLLTDSHKSLAAIAEEVGYESPAAFQRAFKREFAMPPAAWRRNATETTPRAEPQAGLVG